MNSPKLSISVPVYNTEKYLRKCLDSLINQTLRDIEIIIVNDGSIDSSEAICLEYAARDSRIVLINKENGGLASARQVALGVSRGLYFCACDSDDWVELDMYERLYNKAIETEADIVMCDYRSEYPGGKSISYIYPYQLESRKDLLDDALNGKYPCMVWNKIFRRKIFDDYSLNWEPNINLGEDVFLMFKILKCPVKVNYVNATLYHYRREYGGNSYTNMISMETFKQSLFIRQWAMNNIDTAKYSNGIFNLWLSLCFTALRVEDGMSSDYYRDNLVCYVKWRYFLICRYPRIKGLIVLISKLLGYRFAKTLVSFLYEYFYK